MSDQNPRNIIITGIPRSGTTLTAALIDSLPNTVCLNEPAWQTAKKHSSPQAFARWLAEDFVEVRQKLLRGDPIPDSRSHEGLAVTNYYRPGNKINHGNKTHPMENTYRIVPFTRPGLTRDFTLAIKHNSPYLAVLKPLIDLECFTIIVIIRHPVEVIHSWRSLTLPVSEGKLPNAEPYWPQMAQLARTPMDLLEKQIRIYDLICKRIYHLCKDVHILTYEDLIQSPHRLCEHIGVTGNMATNLIERKKNIHVPEAERELIVQALKKYGEYFVHFYPEI